MGDGEGGREIVGDRDSERESRAPVAGHNFASATGERENTNITRRVYVSVE